MRGTSKQQPVDIEVARVHRYKLRAKALGLPEAHWQRFQVLAEGAPHRFTPLEMTLLELVDLLAGPVVDAATHVLENKVVLLNTERKKT
jgi:hypothetical protein